MSFENARRGRAQGARRVEAATIDGRWFALGTVDDASDREDVDPWEVRGDESITLFYNTWTEGTSPPGNIQSLLLELIIDDLAPGGGNTIITLHDGGQLADGTTFTFWATDNGTEQGNPRSGMVRLRVRAERTNLGTYVVDTEDDDAGHTASTGGTSSGHPGVIRSLMVAESIQVPAPPVGALYAHGPQADEGISFTVSHTPLYRTLAAYQLSVAARRDDGTTILLGDPKAGNNSLGETGFTQICDYTLDLAQLTYGTRIEPHGASGLANDNWSDAQKQYTRAADSGHGAGIIVDVPGVYRDAHWTADPRVILDLLTRGRTPRDDDRPEIAHMRIDHMTLHAWGQAKNARDELVGLETENLLFRFKDPSSTLVDSGSLLIGADGWAGAYTHNAQEPIGEWTVEFEYARGDTLETVVRTLQVDHGVGPRRALFLTPRQVVPEDFFDCWIHLQVDGSPVAALGTPTAFAVDVDADEAQAEISEVGTALYRARFPVGVPQRGVYSLQGLVEILDLEVQVSRSLDAVRHVPYHIHNGHWEGRVAFLQIDGLGHGTERDWPVVVLEDAEARQEDGLREAVVVEPGTPEALAEHRAAVVLEHRALQAREISWQENSGLREIERGDRVKRLGRPEIYEVVSADIVEPGIRQVRARTGDDVIREIRARFRRRLRRVERWIR